MPTISSSCAFDWWSPPLSLSVPCHKSEKRWHDTCVTVTRWLHCLEIELAHQFESTHSWSHFFFSLPHLKPHDPKHSSWRSYRNTFVTLWTGSSGMYSFRWCTSTTDSLPNLPFHATFPMFTSFMLLYCFSGLRLRDLCIFRLPYCDPLYTRHNTHSRSFPVKCRRKSVMSNWILIWTHNNAHWLEMGALIDFVFDWVNQPRIEKSRHVCTLCTHVGHCSSQSLCLFQLLQRSPSLQCYHWMH